MGALVQLLAKDGKSSTVRLFEVPHPGDVIECPDGTRMVVSKIESGQPARGVDAEVVVRPA